MLLENLGMSNGRIELFCLPYERKNSAFFLRKRHTYLQDILIITVNSNCNVLPDDEFLYYCKDNNFIRSVVHKSRKRNRYVSIKVYIKLF